MRPLVYILAFAMLSFSCKKEDVKSGKTVEIYALKKYQLVPGKCQIDAALSEIDDTPMIRNQDILQYSRTEYQFKLTAAGIEKVKALRDKTPFAVTVDKEVIYFGFYKPGISSSSCDHSITMDVSWGTDTKISVNLGYPGQLSGVTIDDQRNSPNLITALKNQDKLN